MTGNPGPLTGSGDVRCSFLHLVVPCMLEKWAGGRGDHYSLYSCQAAFLENMTSIHQMYGTTSWFCIKPFLGTRAKQGLEYKQLVVPLMNDGETNLSRCW